MTKDEIGALTEREREWKRLADAATPGPWHPGNYTVGVGEYVWEAFIDGTTIAKSDHDAAFIAAAREAVPSLIATVAELRAALAQVTANHATLYDAAMARIERHRAAREALRKIAECRDISAAMTLTEVKDIARNALADDDDDR